MSKRFLRVIGLFCVTAILGTGLAISAETKKPAAGTKAQTNATQPYGHGMMGHGGNWMNLPPEKQQAAQKLFEEHNKKMFPLNQEIYVKKTELEALMVKPDADQAKVDALVKEISALKSKAFEESVNFRQRMAKEVGIVKPMGRMGGGMGGCMDGSGMGCGECPMMKNMKAGQGSPAAKGKPAPGHGAHN